MWTVYKIFRGEVDNNELATDGSIADSGMDGCDGTRKFIKPL